MVLATYLVFSQLLTFSSDNSLLQNIEPIVSGPALALGIFFLPLLIEILLMYTNKRNHIDSVTAAVSFTKVFAKARLFEASERRCHVSLVVGVDKHCAGVEPFTDIQSFADVSCDNTRCQTILCSIGPSQDIVHLAKEQRQRGHREGVRNSGKNKKRQWVS